jgi:hypothetical protein
MPTAGSLVCSTLDKRETFMIHPDDRHLLTDWPIYGPKNGTIADLVEALAEKGMRVAETERMIEAYLRLRLAELEASPANQGSSATTVGDSVTPHETRSIDEPGDKESAPIWTRLAGIADDLKPEDEEFCLLRAAREILSPDQYARMVKSPK